MPVAGAVIRELTELEKLCTVCDVPGGCDDKHPFCKYRAARELGNGLASPERMSDLMQKRRYVLERLAQVDEEDAAYFTNLWQWTPDDVSKIIMRPLRDKGYIERADGRNGAYARWRLANGNAT